MASFLGLKHVVQDILLEEETDVINQGGHYGTALQVASGSGHKDIVEILLEKGADINIEVRYQGTPLQAALAHGHKDIVEILLEKGADINIKVKYQGIMLLLSQTCAIHTILYKVSECAQALGYVFFFKVLQIATSFRHSSSFKASKYNKHGYPKTLSTLIPSFKLALMAGLIKRSPCNG